MATLPGVRSPSCTGACSAWCGTLARNLVRANSGNQALRSTSRAFSISARTGLLRFMALAACTTTGIPAKLPWVSVEAKNLAEALTSPFLN